MSRILVTGSRGLLGREVVAAARAAGHEVHGLARSEAEPCDLTDAAAVRTLVGRLQPELVIHAGAWTDVDGCELDPGRAHAVNADGTVHVRSAADLVGAHVVLLSTDHVFDGAKDEGYVEDDPTAPCSAYGRSKAAAEEALGSVHTVVRTSWLAGRHGTGFVQAILRRGASGEPFPVVEDQVGHPTLTACLAPALLQLGLQRSAGTYHVTNAGAVSRLTLARATLAAAGLDPDLVEAIRTADLDPPRPAPRPANAVLVDTRLAAAGIAPLPHHGEPLARLVAALVG